jgi:hypothetical protein
MGTVTAVRTMMTMAAARAVTMTMAATSVRTVTTVASVRAVPAMTAVRPTAAVTGLSDIANHEQGDRQRRKTNAQKTLHPTLHNDVNQSHICSLAEQATVASSQANQGPLLR